jgi:pilus assembly protein CpaC
VRTKFGITIASCGALSFLLCAVSPLQAQTPPLPDQPAAASVQDSTNELYVAVGKTVLVDLAKPISRVTIGLGDIAVAQAISRTEIMVNGKAPGETSLIIWDTKGGRQFFNVTVRASTAQANDSLDAVRRELRIELPGQTLKISAEGGSIFLRGNVKDLTSSERAVKIASIAGKVVNLLNVDLPPVEPQILLKVRFAAVDRSKAAQYGINLVNLGLGNTVGGITTGQFSPPSVTIPTSGPVATFSNELNMLAMPIGNWPVGIDIQALQTKGVVETLAEPNVLAVNGKEASFLAGGEYPYPVVQGSSGGTSISIMFKEYGVRLNFIPTITPRGTIRLQVAPEVSALDFTNALELSGFTVPGITSRKMKTEVELNDGQTFVLGGLLDNRETETFEKIPFIGDIPILGKLFQSSTKTRNNTELIVTVTPEVVAPMQAGAPLPELKFPVKFLPPNSAITLNTPDAKTAANTQAPPPATIPVETLIDSMKPEAPLVIEGSTGFGGASGGISSAAPSGAGAGTGAGTQ